jgi:hypothetical protein
VFSSSLYLILHNRWKLCTIKIAASTNCVEFHVAEITHRSSAMVVVRPRWWRM